MWLFLFKILFAETNRAFISGVALFVVLFSFSLFALNADGWRFGIIGLGCLGILSLNDLLSRLIGPSIKTSVPNIFLNDFSSNDFKRFFQILIIIQKIFTQILVKKYALPDSVQNALKNETLTPQALSLFTKNLSEAQSILQIFHTLNVLKKTFNTMSSFHENVS